MEGAVLDNASMVRCNFEDLKLRPSSLLGAQMKCVNLEVRETTLRTIQLYKLIVNLELKNLKNLYFICFWRPVSITDLNVIFFRTPT